MSKGQIVNSGIVRVVIFVELEDGTVRQVISTPTIKLRAASFIAAQAADGILAVGDAEDIEFHQLKNKEVE